MANIQKHIGILKNTGSRVYVVMRSLPGEPESCLVCYSDSLPERYAHKVANIVQGVGQTHPELYEVFQQNTLERADMLTELHKTGYLKKQAVANVRMILNSSAQIDLSVLNESIAENERMKGEKINGFNPMKDYATDDSSQYSGVVQKLLDDAKQHAEQAELLFARAYEIDPSTRPTQKVEDEQRVVDDGETFTITFENKITQAKAIDLVRSVLRERKGK